jgi:hypothetical protein
LNAANDPNLSQQRRDLEMERYLANSRSQASFEQQRDSFRSRHQNATGHQTGPATNAPPPRDHEEIIAESSTIGTQRGRDTHNNLQELVNDLTGGATPTPAREDAAATNRFNRQLDEIDGTAPPPSNAGDTLDRWTR